MVSRGGGGRAGWFDSSPSRVQEKEVDMWDIMREIIGMAAPAAGFVVFYLFLMGVSALVFFLMDDKFK